MDRPATNVSATALLVLWFAIGVGGACAEEVPTSGPARLAWMRTHLRNTVSKFEFTQGYSFRKHPERLRPFLQAVKARGFSVWDQHAAGYIWDEEQFASLERSLQAAADVGLKVWATLVPPSEKAELRRMPEPERRAYFVACVERFARLAVKYPNFVAFTCDDFSNDLGFFTPEVLGEMARRWRAICPRLAFVPLVYWPGVTKELFATRGEFIDGIVFHYRAESYPPAIIPGYDPKSFEMYGDVMRYELKRARQIAGDHVLICGIYIWYYKRGWGVLTPDEKNPTVEHIVRDSVQKLDISHEYADGIRVYGLGIGHAAYRGMSERLATWQAKRQDWGLGRGEPTDHLARWQKPMGEGPVLGTLLRRERGLGRALPKACSWPRRELASMLRRGEFEPVDIARRVPLLVVSADRMPKAWPGLLAAYARAGGVLALEYVPGWWLDTEGHPLTYRDEWEGGKGILTRQFARLSGVAFRYNPRGFATRWRVVKAHPLTKGLGKVGEWQSTAFKPGASTYGYLVHPVTATDGEVLVEAEHERCPYTGVAYERQGTLNGVFPLLTVRREGKGLVVRHYAAVSPGAVFGDAYKRLLANLIEVAK